MATVKQLKTEIAELETELEIAEAPPAAPAAPAFGTSDAANAMLAQLPDAPGGVAGLKLVDRPWALMHLG